MTDKRTERDQSSDAPPAAYDPKAPILYESMSELEITAAITSAIQMLRGIITDALAAAEENAPTPAHASAAGASASSTETFLQKVIAVFKGESDRRTGRVMEPMPPREMSKENPRVFGVPLTDLELTRVDGLLIPTPFASLIKEIRSRDISVEGIFRVAGNKRRKHLLRTSIEKGESLEAIPELNIHDFCDIFKEMLREVPDKVIPSTFAAIFSGIARMLEIKADEKEIVRTSNFFLPFLTQFSHLLMQVTALQLFHLILPPLNRRFMQVLVNFLAAVHADHTNNLMTASNLAKIFIPNLSQEDCISTDPACIADTQTKLAALFAFTIEHAKDVFYVPKAVAGQRVIRMGCVQTAFSLQK